MTRERTRGKPRAPGRQQPGLCEEGLLVLDTGRGQQRALEELVATARQIQTAIEKASGWAVRK